MAIELTDRPAMEVRVEEAVSVFREQHRHPANLALHAVGYLLVAKGLRRVLRFKLLSGAFRIGAGVGLVVAGHRIEGNDPFTTVKALTGR